MYTENGVNITKKTLVEHQKSKLRYQGLLCKNGAEEIYVHLGYGLLWDDLTEIKMTKKDNYFETELFLAKADSLNFCFRDNHNNWDNNNYQNYSYEVMKITPAETSTSKKKSPSKTSIRKSNSMIDSLDLTKKSVTTESLNKKGANSEISCSLVPAVSGDLYQFKRLPENYIRNKKMRVLFYRMFSYVPRLLNGYNKKRAKSFLKR